jgi:hypothetical protein
MKMKNLVSVILFLGIAMGCGQDQNSELSLNARPENPNVKLYRVKDAQNTDYVMKSNGRGYKLACNNDIFGLLRLIEAFGYPSQLVAASPIISRDSQEFQELAFDDQLELNCSPANYFLYKLIQGTQTKYFFAQKSAPTRLFMFGCQALPGAMGFDLSTAKAIDPEFITTIPVFKSDDKDDIDCLKGVSFDVGLTWSLPSDQKIMVTPNQSLPVQILLAKRPDGTPAVITHEKGENCSWLTLNEVSGSLILSGVAPADFKGKTCNITVTADKGMFQSESKQIQLISKTPRLETRPNICSQELVTIRDDSKAPTRQLEDKINYVDSTETIVLNFDPVGWANFKKDPQVVLNSISGNFCYGGKPAGELNKWSNPEFLTADYPYKWRYPEFGPIPRDQIVSCGIVSYSEEPIAGWPAGSMKMSVIPGLQYKKYIQTVPTKQILKKTDPTCPDSIQVEVYD